MVTWCGVVSVVAQSSVCIRGRDGQYYRTEVIPTNFSLGNNVASDWKNNKIYVIAKSPNSKYHIVEYNMNDGEFKTLAEAPYDCSMTVDQGRGHLYAGCNCYDSRASCNGLFIYGNNSQQFQRLIAEEKPIKMVHFADDAIYYSDQETYQLQVYSNGHDESVPDFDGTSVFRFVVDGHGNKVFLKVWRLYYQKAGTKAFAHIANDRFIGYLAVDPSGKVYGCGIPPEGSFYHINITNNTISRVAIYQNKVNSFTFDKDGNFVFADTDNNNLVQIVRC